MGDETDCTLEAGLEVELAKRFFTLEDDDEIDVPIFFAFMRSDP